MLRQRFGLNPATGRVEHYYADEGPQATGIGNQRPVIHTFVPGGASIQNVTTNGGQKIKPLRGLGA